MCIYSNQKMALGRDPIINPYIGDIMEPPTTTIPWIIPNSFNISDELQVARVRELLKEFQQLRARLKCTCCTEHTTEAEKQRYNDLLALLGDLIKWD